VPTNAQVALTLLRIGERNKAPLPPPPSESNPPDLTPHEGAAQQAENLGGSVKSAIGGNTEFSQAVTDEELQAAIHPDEKTVEAHEEAKTTKPKKGSKIISFLKGTTKGGVSTALGVDKVKASVGARHAKDRLGVIKYGPDPETGPIRFPARYKGHKGHAYITATATTPALSWTSSIEDLNPAWTVAIADIAELRKVGGLGWKSKLVVGWALEREVADGLVIKDKLGHEWHITALTERDELFNRLIAIGSQMWEAA
jgi:hypothetical protein